MKIRVYYKDTDAGGIVYHANYLNFCEMARSELFFAEGRSPVIDGCHFAVKKIEADFLKPAYLGDLLEVKTTMISMKHTSFTLSQTIFRGIEPLFTMKVMLVFLCNDKKPHRIDEETKRFFMQRL